MYENRCPGSPYGQRCQQAIQRDPRLKLGWYPIWCGWQGIDTGILRKVHSSTGFNGGSAYKNGVTRTPGGKTLTL